MRRPSKRLIAACVAAALGATAVHGLLSANAQLGDPSTAPEIKHVFTIVLENESANTTFAANSPAPYLSKTLRSRGAFLPNYYGIGHQSLDNYVAMISGQSPTIITQADCPAYIDVIPALATTSGQVVGQGCVYPAGTTQTVANLLEDHGFTWKGYMEDMAAKAPTSCRHPSLNSLDSTQSAHVGDQYAARHNPFVYFHSLTDLPTNSPRSTCTQHDVDYRQLAGDLASKATTPNYSFISPNLCHDGHDTPCVSGEPGGLVTADKWLHDNVPAILASPAYNDHGLLMIIFDEGAGGTSPTADASGCCNEPTGPNTINPGGLALGPGGGKTGAVLLSPCIAPGTVDSTPYNHYSMLRSVENFFALPYLGYSGQAGLSAFGNKIFTAPACTSGGGGGGGGGASNGGGTGGVAGANALAAGSKLKLKVKPKRRHAGRRDCFRAKVTANGGPVSGATVRLGKVSKLTKANGGVRICRRFAHPHKVKIRAIKLGFQPATRRVKIV